MNILRQITEEFRQGRNLTSDDAESFLDALISETDEISIAKVLRAWNEKGIAEIEIFEIASILRKRMTRVNSRHETLVDIVGTGGSKSKTFNVSTAAAFVVAGAEIPVAKHGNKAATSNSGSSDVLSALGIDPAVDAVTAEKCLNNLGICFMFAPNHHRLSLTLAKVRRGLGFPTIFNCVGPLCNPASAQHQLIGVWDRELVPKMANALARLGTKKSWIVHGQDGLDEITLNGKTFVAEVNGADIREFSITPSDFGFTAAAVESFSVKTPAESAKVIMNVLTGKHRNHDIQNFLLMNAAAAIGLTNQGDDFQSSVSYANDSIVKGNALTKIKKLAEMTQK